MNNLSFLNFPRGNWKMFSTLRFLRFHHQSSVLIIIQYLVDLLLRVDLLIVIFLIKIFSIPLMRWLCLCPLSFGDMTALTKRLRQKWPCVVFKAALYKSISFCLPCWVLPLLRNSHIRWEVWQHWSPYAAQLMCQPVWPSGPPDSQESLQTPEALQ